MRGLTVLLLVSMTLAGCTVQEPTTPSAPVGSTSEGEFQVDILFDARNVYYVGDQVSLEASADGTVSYLWSMGDGTELEGARIKHFYLAAGDYDVRVDATRADGAAATARITLAIADLYGGGPTPPPPAPTGDESGIIQVVLVGDEPSEGGMVRLALQGPAALSEPGQWTVWIGPQAYTRNFSALPDAMDLAMPERGRQQLLWHATIGASEYLGNVTFDVWGTPIEFGEPTAQQWLRPGSQTVAGGAQCTTNFIFHYKWYRFFIGSAAHCIDSVDINDVCQQGSDARIGSKQTVTAHDGSKSAATTLAYSSWLTMESKGGGSCPANDFALYELGSQAQQHMHPKALFFGGPTALAPTGGYGLGGVLYGYGASQLHGNVGVAYPGQDVVNSKRGVSLGVSGGGYSQGVYYAIPGIPGDSGGPAFGPNGEALGAASTIVLSPTTGSNHYTIIPKALEYMQEKEGWAPELMTYATWSSTGA